MAESVTGYGYRVWMIQDPKRGAPVHLHSIAIPWVWRPGINEAVCELSTASLRTFFHPAPARDCMCGLWSVYDIDKARTVQFDYRRQFALAFAMNHLFLKGDVRLEEAIDNCSGAPCFVIGAVRYWGRTAVHDDGVRAEYAQPIALVRPVQHPATEAAIRRAAQQYDVPTFSSPEALRLHVESLTG